MEGNFPREGVESKPSEASQDPGVYINSSQDVSLFSDQSTRDFVFSTADLRDQPMFSGQSRDLVYPSQTRGQMVFVSQDSGDYVYQSHQASDVLLNAQGRELLFTEGSRDLMYPHHQDREAIFSSHAPEVSYHSIPQTQGSEYPSQSRDVLYQDPNRMALFHTAFQNRNTGNAPQTAGTEPSYSAQRSAEHFQTRQRSEEMFVAQSTESTAAVPDKKREVEDFRIQNVSQPQLTVDRDLMTHSDLPLSKGSPHEGQGKASEEIVKNTQQNPDILGLSGNRAKTAFTESSGQEERSKEAIHVSEKALPTLPDVNRTLALPSELGSLASDVSRMHDVSEHVLVYEGNMQFSCLFCNEKIVVSCQPQGHVVIKSRDKEESLEGKINLEPELVKSVDIKSVSVHASYKEQAMDAEEDASYKNVHISSGMFGKKKAAGKHKLVKSREPSVQKQIVKYEAEDIEDLGGNSEEEDEVSSLEVKKRTDALGRGKRKKSSKNLVIIMGKKSKKKKERKKVKDRNTGKEPKHLKEQTKLEGKRKVKKSARSSSSSPSMPKKISKRKMYKVKLVKGEEKPRFLLKTEVKESISVHQCVLCNKVVEGENAIQKHLKKHMVPSSYDCEVCQKSFRIPSQLLRHKSIVHEGVRPFKCDICGKSFAKRDRLQTHKDTHSGHKPHTCPVCGMAFTHSGNMRRHLLTHNGERRFHCEICGKKFFQKINLISHQRLHTGERPYRCEFCGKSFRQRSNLSSHQKVHGINRTPPRTDGVERPYICEICGKAFKQKAGLCTHKKSHAEIKPLACEFCNKRFTQKTTLMQHRRLHTGEKPYSCAYCGKKFASLNNRKRHEKIHTGERPFKCETCGKAFIQKVGLTAHMKTHEKKEEPKFFLNVVDSHLPMEPPNPVVVSQPLQPILNPVHYEWTLQNMQNC